MADDFSWSVNTTGFIAVNGSATGNLETVGDHDWFRTGLVAGNSYVIDVLGSASGGGTLGDPNVGLRNFLGDLIIFNEDSGRIFDPQLSFSLGPQTTGTFFIDVGAFLNAFTGTYTVELHQVAATRFQAPHFGLASFAPGAGGWSSEDQYPRLVGNADGDDTGDIIGFGASGVFVSLGTGLGNFAAPQFKLAAFSAAQGWTSQDQYPRQFSDVNGDFRSDIVGFGAQGVFVSLQGPPFNGDFTAPQLKLAAFSPAQGWTSQDLYPRFLTPDRIQAGDNTSNDLNNDNRADIVGFGANGVYTSLATGGGNFAAPQFKLAAFSPAQGWTSENQYPRELADVNGDHLTDIVGFGAAGVFVALNTGGGNFANPILASTAFGAAGGWTSQDLYPRLLADVNNDGRADIVAFGASNVFFALGQANGTFAAPVTDLAGLTPNNGGWTSENLYPRLLGDVTGDGRADIVGFGQSGVFTSQSLDHLLIV